MKKLIFDDITRRCIGSVEGNAEFQGRGLCVPLSSLPADLDLAYPSCLFLASDGAARDFCGALKRAGGKCFVRTVAGDAPVRLASL